MNQLSITRFPALDYAATEAMNTLCTNISYCGQDVRVVLFTSRYEEEGKSSISMNVMRTLAGYGKRVLLVDADLRRSSLARRYRFGYSTRDAYGLAQYLAGMCSLDEVVYQTDLPNAYILPAGRDVLNSMQLLASARYGEMMGILRREFDMILVDTPPAGLIVDAVEIAKYCDGAVIVVGYNKGRGQDLSDVVANISKTGCKVLGAVMNGVNLKSFRNRRYYYRSERYSAYYSHYAADARTAGTGRSRTPRGAKRK
jgi:protein-tyrosine kinase